MVVGIDDVDDLLLVEDNPGDVRLIEEAFGAASLDPTIHTARSSDAAREFLTRCGDDAAVPRPDLVLLDWSLSRQTGQQVVEAVDSVDAAIPVVVMTGSRPQLERIESSTPAADAYIQKQTDPHQYIEVLRSIANEE